MIVEDLKISILEKAIHGKLVANNSDKKIIDEELREFYKKYDGKEEKIENYDFDLPDSWRWVKLDNITFSNIGLTYKPSNVSKEGTIVLRSNNIKDGIINEEDFVHVNISVPDNKLCHPGDILMCSRNGSKRLVGKCAIIEKEGYSFGAFMAIIRSDITDYLYYVFNSNYFRKKMLGDASTTTINQITQKMLANFWVPLPPLEEQKRIVEKIRLLFKKIEEIKPVEEELYNLKSNFPKKFQKSILQNLMQINNENNSCFEKIKMADLVHITTGKKDANYGSDSGEYYFFTCSKEPIKCNGYSFEGESVLLAGNGNIGNINYYDGKFEAYQRTYVLQKKSDKINMKYLYYHLLANWEEYNNYQIYGTAIPYIKLGNVQNFIVNCPSIEKQSLIVEKIDELMPLLNYIDNIF